MQPAQLPAGFPDAVQLLTRQEKRLLRLTAPNRRTKQIMADVPELTAGTIDAYCASAARKLGATDRYQAAQWLAAYEASVSEKSELRSPALPESQKSDIFEPSEPNGTGQSEVREERAEFRYGPTFQTLSFLRLFLSWMQMVQQSMLLKFGCAVAVAIGLAVAAAGVAALASTMQDIRDRISRNAP